MRGGLAAAADEELEDAVWVEKDPEEEKEDPVPELVLSTSSGSIPSWRKVALGSSFSSKKTKEKPRHPSRRCARSCEPVRFVLWQYWVIRLCTVASRETRYRAAYMHCSNDWS